MTTKTSTLKDGTTVEILDSKAIARGERRGWGAFEAIYHFEVDGDSITVWGQAGTLMYAPDLGWMCRRIAELVLDSRVCGSKWTDKGWTYRKDVR